MATEFGLTLGAGKTATLVTESISMAGAVVGSILVTAAGFPIPPVRKTACDVIARLTPLFELEKRSREASGLNSAMKFPPPIPNGSFNGKSGDAVAPVTQMSPEESRARLAPESLQDPPR